MNPGNTAFQEALNSMIYVDKSRLIAYTSRVLNTKQKNLCVSRPWRFGKSMAADMLTAYYSKGCSSGKLFAGLEIERGRISSICQNNRWQAQRHFGADILPDKNRIYGLSAGAF